MEDDEIRSLVKRLARPDRSGGATIERAAIMATGADYQSVIAWIADHDGRPEAAAPSSASKGLHEAQSNRMSADRPPARYVLPAGALS